MNTIHANSCEMHVSGESFDSLMAQMMTVCSHCDCKCCFVCCAGTQLGETRKQGGFSSTEADTHATVLIQFVKPVDYLIERQHGLVFWRIAVWADQVTDVRQRNGHLPRRGCPQLRVRRDFLQKDVHARSAVKNMQTGRPDAKFNSGTSRYGISLQIICAVQNYFLRYRSSPLIVRPSK